MKLRRGFTLIELLVVVAIIGILAAMVLVALNTARQKAKDGRIKGSMSQIRSQAQVFSDTMSTYDGVEADDTVNTLEADIVRQGGVVTWGVTDVSGYVVAASLASDATRFFCADSTGVAGMTGTALDAADTACPAGTQ